MIPSAVVFMTSRKRQFSRSLIQGQLLSLDIEASLVPRIFCMKVSALLAMQIYYLTCLISINDYNIMFGICIYLFPILSFLTSLDMMFGILVPDE